MMSQIRTMSPPTRIFTSERQAAPTLPKSRGLGTVFRLPSPRRIHPVEAVYVRHIRHSATQAPCRLAAFGVGVSCMLLVRDGGTTLRAPAAQEAVTRLPVSLPGGERPLPIPA